MCRYNDRIEGARAFIAAGLMSERLLIFQGERHKAQFIQYQPPGNNANRGNRLICLYDHPPDKAGR